MIMSEANNSLPARYYIHRGELYRILNGEMIPTAWSKGSWEKKPFVFELEATGHMISEEEAKDWIKINVRRKRRKGRT